MSEINKYKINDDVYKLVKLISSQPLNHSHLQVFLHRKNESDCKHNYEFLMVTPTSFGKVELLDINVEGDYVIIEFLDCAMQQVGKTRININDEKPSVLFIRWHDIIDMSKEFNKDIGNDNALLEFDF